MVDNCISATLRSAHNMLLHIYLLVILPLTAAACFQSLQNFSQKVQFCGIDSVLRPCMMHDTSGGMVISPDSLFRAVLDG
jgi:hypothetical protein